MVTIVGVFSSRGDGGQAVRALTAAGFREDRITLLAPGASDAAVAAIPTTEAEAPGIGKAIGGVVGGAAGASGGMQAAALVSMIVPGVGPVFVLGAIGAALLGMAGYAIGGALDRNSSQGLPRDEVFVYEDALRRGRTVVVALAEDEDEATRGREILADAGAETIDAAREQWWLGLRDAEAAEYETTGGDFARDEARYRLGFEAAQGFGDLDRAYDDVVDELRARCPEAYRDDSFRRGYERGRAHRRAQSVIRRAA